MQMHSVEYIDIVRPFAIVPPQRSHVVWVKNLSIMVAPFLENYNTHFSSETKTLIPLSALPAWLMSDSISPSRSTAFGV